MVNKLKEERKAIKILDKSWVARIKDRDKNRCVICNKKENINAHHIIPRQISDFRWDIDNGITLCVKHHRFSFELSAHQSPFLFYKVLNGIRNEQLIRLFNKCKEVQT